MRGTETTKSGGFGIVGIISIVVVLAVLGLIGWKVYEASKVKTNKNSTSSQTSNSGDTTGKTNSSTPPVDTATYLDIKELGVKMKLEDGVKDATYAVQTLDDGSLVARLSTQALAAADPACDASSGQLGALTKSTTDTDRFGNKLVPDGKSTFKFGDNYFTFANSQALCSEKVRTTVGAAQTAMRQSLTTLQLDQ